MSSVTIEEAENYLEPIEGSSNIQGIGYKKYEGETGGDLFVRFLAGVYVYRDVPEEVFNELAFAESRGKYFHQHIKGKYDFEKVETDRLKPTEG